MTPAFLDQVDKRVIICHGNLAAHVDQTLAIDRHTSLCSTSRPTDGGTRPTDGGIMGSQRCEDDTCSLCGRVRTARNAFCETCGCVVCEACLEDHGPGWWCDECYGGSFAVYKTGERWALERRAT